MKQCALRLLYVVKQIKKIKLMAELSLTQLTPEQHGGQGC